MTYFDKQKFIDILEAKAKKALGTPAQVFCHVVKMLEVLPAVDVEEVKYGEWIDRYGGKYANSLFDCSVCRKKALYRFEIDGLGMTKAKQELSMFLSSLWCKNDGR